MLQYEIFEGVFVSQYDIFMAIMFIGSIGYIGLLIAIIRDKIEFNKLLKESYVPDKSFLLIEDYTKENYCPTSEFEVLPYLDDISFVIEAEG